MTKERSIAREHLSWARFFIDKLKFDREPSQRNDLIKAAEQRLQFAKQFIDRC